MTHLIRSEDHGSHPVVVVAGDADASASAAIDAAIGGAVDRDLSRLVIVDLTEANFIDSRTMGVLVRWSDRLRAGGGRLPIVCLDPRMLRLFSLIGLEQSLEFHESRASVIGAA